MAIKSKQFSGQGLVEFALTLPVLLFLVIGTLDLGSAFFMKVELENAAREGAYYLVYNTAEGKVDAFALTKTAAQIEGENSGITIPLADIEVSCVEGVTVNNACPSGSTVIVTLSHQMSLALDIFFNGPLTLTGDARMLIP